MGISRYRSKPVEIEAIQWDGTEETANAINVWIDRVREDRGWEPLGTGGFRFSTLDGHFSEVYNHSHDDWNRVNVGDWVARGTKDEFYPIDPETFALRYDPVDIPLISSKVPDDSPFREGAGEGRD